MKHQKAREFAEQRLADNIKLCGDRTIEDLKFINYQELSNKLTYDLAECQRVKKILNAERRDNKIVCGYEGRDIFNELNLQVENLQNSLANEKKDNFELKESLKNAEKKKINQIGVNYLI